MIRFCSPRTLMLEISFQQVYQDSDLLDEFENGLISLKNNIQLPRVSYIVQSSQGLAFSQKLEDKEVVPIYKIEMEEINSNQIIFRKLTQNQNYLYRILQKECPLPLFKDDIIKLGQFQILVKKVFISNQSNKQKVNLPLNHLELKVSKQTPKGQSIINSQLQISCRICFQKEQLIQDPLISLCRCSGTIGYTHYTCMKQWYKKFLIKQQSTISDHYRFSRAICDLCKQQIPQKFTHKQLELSLLDVNQPQCSYIILSINNNPFTEIICVKFNKEDLIVSIGSDQNADLCFDDNMIDLIHAQLKIVDNKITIQDKQSYEGTLMRLKNNTHFNSNQVLKMRISNIKMNLSTQKGMLDWLCPVDNYNLKILPSNQRQT